jgi:hypothetical protein
LERKEYPKVTDCGWSKQVDRNKGIICEMPFVSGTMFKNSLLTIDILFR